MAMRRAQQHPVKEAAREEPAGGAWVVMDQRGALLSRHPTLPDALKGLEHAGPRALVLFIPARRRELRH